MWQFKVGQAILVTVPLSDADDWPFAQKRAFVRMKVAPWNGSRGYSPSTPEENIRARIDDPEIPEVRVVTIKVAWIENLGHHLLTD